ncbi:hypothetical protein MJM45_30600, partial [Salmonella enterica subsp. enterica serovar Kentucky]|nr:hypothetical protein [Salmonella enterica subsp. enterica serovar Kentucky]
MLKSPLLWKMITLGGAMILLLIPLMMVRHTIVDVLADHAESSCGCRPAERAGERRRIRHGRFLSPGQSAARYSTG